MIVLTYNDAPSGIYNSQVIDVVKHLDSIQKKERVRLIALVSARNYFADRRKIKARLPQSLVLPMVPKPALWRLNFYPLFVLFLFLSSKNKVMARGPFAACLALCLKKYGLVKKVIFDARGAYEAELNEYQVTSSEKLKRDIPMIERQALLQSDARLAVSGKLVDYWKMNYDYDLTKHVVVPCTLSEDFIFSIPSSQALKELKVRNGFSENDKVLVYSGSSAGWQSFALVQEALSKLMKADEQVKLLLLTNHFDKNSAFYKAFENRIVMKWVQPKEVRDLLLSADHGILFREQSVTNKVASPVKFAEYLACGLKVIISEELGDYTELVRRDDLGSVDFPSKLEAVPYEEKKRLHLLSQQQFTKENYTQSYLQLLDL